MLGWIKSIFSGIEVETRSSGAGYTAQIMAARESYISGVSGLGELTGAVQTSISLWEGALAAADVQGTDFITRRTMAITARSLALRGEAVFLIRNDGLLPCADWDLSTRHGEPRAYRVSVSESGGGYTQTALAGEVLHFRIGADQVAPWTGTAPLRRAPISAQLLHEVESALRDVYRDAPLGSMILPLPDSQSGDMDDMRGAFRGRRGATLVVEGVAQATAAGMNPQLGQKPDALSPDLSKSMTAETLEAARDGIYAAYGVLPGLHNRATTGPMVREAQRHLAQWTLQPIALLMSEEASQKLGGDIFIDVMRPVQAYDVGGRARALSAIVTAIAQAKEQGLSPAEFDFAAKLVNWGENDKAA